MSSILRLWAFVTRDYSSPDLTYTTANPAIWSCVEASIAITSACLPSLRPVFAAMGTTYSNLRTKQSNSFSSGSRRTGFSRQLKSDGDVPQLQMQSSKPSDRVKLHHVLKTHPMTERFKYLDLPTEPEASRPRSDDVWSLHSDVPQNWAYPAPLNIRKGAVQV